MSLLADATIRASIVLLIGLLAMRAVPAPSMAGPAPRRPRRRDCRRSAGRADRCRRARRGRADRPRRRAPGADRRTAIVGAAATAPAETAVTAATTGRRGNADAPVAAGVSWAALALALWSAGAAVSLGWLLVAFRAPPRPGREAQAVVEDVRWRRALDAVCRDAGAPPARAPARRAATRLLLATWGWRRPRVVIPACGLGWSDERVRTVLAHEVAHVVRHDWLLQSVAETLRALLWWNPLAWLACRALRDDSELACDDAVLHAGVGATAYADHLAADRPHRRSRPGAGGGRDADGSCLHPRNGGLSRC